MIFHSYIGLLDPYDNNIVQLDNIQKRKLELVVLTNGIIYTATMVIFMYLFIFLLILINKNHYDKNILENIYSSTIDIIKPISEHFSKNVDYMNLPMEKYINNILYGGFIMVILSIVINIYIIPRLLESIENDIHVDILKKYNINHVIYEKLAHKLTKNFFQKYTITANYLCIFILFCSLYSYGVFENNMIVPLGILFAIIVVSIISKNEKYFNYIDIFINLFIILNCILVYNYEYGNMAIFMGNILVVSMIINMSSNKTLMKDYQDDKIFINNIYKDLRPIKQNAYVPVFQNISWKNIGIIHEQFRVLSCKNISLDINQIVSLELQYISPIFLKYLYNMPMYLDNNLYNYSTNGILTFVDEEIPREDNWNSEKFLRYWSDCTQDELNFYLKNNKIKVNNLFVSHMNNKEYVELLQILLQILILKYPNRVFIIGEKLLNDQIRNLKPTLLIVDNKINGKYHTNMIITPSIYNKYN